MGCKAGDYDACTEKAYVSAGGGAHRPECRKASSINHATNDLEYVKKMMRWCADFAVAFKGELKSCAK